MGTNAHLLAMYSYCK